MPTTTIELYLPPVATPSNYSPGYSASAIFLYMLVDTTPTSITYNPTGNTSGNTPTYNIISLSSDPTFTNNFINPVCKINQLFDLEHMCFVPSYDYTNPLYPSVEIYVNIDENSAFNNNMYNYIEVLNFTLPSNLTSFFLLYGTSGNTSLNYFKQVGSSIQSVLTLSPYSPPTSTLGATCTLSSSGVDPATGTVVTASSSASVTARGDNLKDALKALLKDVPTELLLEEATIFSSRLEKATYTLSVKLDK